MVRLLIDYSKAKLKRDDHKAPFSFRLLKIGNCHTVFTYEGWNFSSGNYEYLFTTDTK